MTVRRVTGGGGDPAAPFAFTALPEVESAGRLWYDRSAEKK